MMTEPLLPSARLLLLLAVLALAGFTAGPAGAFDAPVGEPGGGVQAPAAADTGRIRMEGVRIRTNGGARVPNTGINNHLLVVGYSMFLDAPAEKERME